MLDRREGVVEVVEESLPALVLGGAAEADRVILERSPAHEEEVAVGGFDAAVKLGLRHTASVPEAFRAEYGKDTVWPAALVVDRQGIIRHAEVSRHVTDRPDPETLLEVLRQVA